VKRFTVAFSCIVATAFALQNAFPETPSGITIQGVVLQAPETRAALAKQGAEVIVSSPDEFKALIENEIVKWSKIIQQTGITAE